MGTLAYKAGWRGSSSGEKDSGRERVERLRSLGVDMAALMEQERRIFVVADLQARFLAPARLNDNLIVTARLAGLTRVSFDIEQNIYRDTVDGGEQLLAANVKAAYLHADTMRPKRIPSTLFGDK